MKLFLKRYRRRLGAFLTALFLMLAIGLAGPSALPDGAQLIPSATAQPTPIRRINPAAISAYLYEQLPNFPLENQYVSSDTGAPATENTLISRLIRYHIYIKNRPTVFRLDWKLTLADYLGAYERIRPNSYVDYGLRENPYAGDIAVMESLSVEQRNTLVNALYEAFTTADEPSTNAPEPTADEPATSSETPAAPPTSVAPSVAPPAAPPVAL